MTTSVAPGQSNFRIAGSATLRASISSLTRIRSAWKRRAFSAWVARRASTDSRTATRSSLVRRGRSARRRTMRLASDAHLGACPARSAAISSPFGAVARKPSAVSVPSESILMSSATPRRKVKPRRSLSSCRELTPRSRSAPASPSTRSWRSRPTSLKDIRTSRTDRENPRAGPAPPRAPRRRGPDPPPGSSGTVPERRERVPLLLPSHRGRDRPHRSGTA